MKSLVKNSFYNIVYKCLNVFFPLITSAYVSRVLLAEGVGKVSAAQNIVSYFTILAALGLPTYGVKMIASSNKNRKEESKIFSELFLINAISTLSCSFLYYFLIFTLPYFQERKILAAVCGLSIVFNIINIDWFYQGKEEYRYIMLRSIIVKILLLVATVCFVKEKEDYIIYALILTLANGTNYIFNIIHVRKYVDFTTQGVKIALHLKPIVILLAASVAVEVYTLADTTMLTFIKGEKVVGYYTTAMKTVQVVKVIATSVCAVFLPRLSYYYATGKRDNFNNLVERGIKILAYITIPAFVGIVLVAEDLIYTLFGKGFSESILTLQILACSIVTISFSNFIGYQILVTVGKEKIMFISTLVGAIVNVILNTFLIPHYGHNGAAMASAITEFSVMLVQCVAIKEYVKIKISGRFIFSLLTSCVCMIICVIVIQQYINLIISRLIISVLCGTIVYFATSIVLKNELTLEGIRYLRKR